MSFTDEEKQQWLRDKQVRERETPPLPKESYAICLHCNNPFGITEGVVTSEAAICDVCNGI